MILIRWANSIKNYLLHGRQYDNPGWTKNKLLRIITTELQLESQGNDFVIRKNPKIMITFGSSNFAQNSNIELVASLYFRNKNEEYLTWESLFLICKQFYGDKYRALTIKKNEEWDASTISRECTEVYAPLIELLRSDEQLPKIMAGEQFEICGKHMTMRKIDHLDFSQ